jgi:hypothetical protein
VDQFIASLPKTLLAIIVLVSGLFLIRFLQPPKTICDAQFELFRDSQKQFLYPGPVVNDIVKSTMVSREMELCKTDNSPGGCFELFQSLKKMSIDLYNIPEQCAEAAAAEKEIQEWLWRSLKLMVQIAWGERPPVSYTQKNGWFDSSELSLFCSLRRESIRIFGNEVYRNWQEGMLSSMPQAEKLTRDQVWGLSLLSTPCDLYR